MTTSHEGASWSQTNTYDRYGNRSIVGGPLSFTASNNRITGWSYDAAGNLLNDGAHGYTFDAENKISKVDGVSAYVYDGDGQRVRKLVNENLRFVYGIGGQQIAEFDGSTGALKKEYVYGASGLVATIEPTAVNANGTRYTTSDHLGSPRLVTNASAGVISRHDYMPFGEELFNGGRTFGMGYGTTDGLRQKFTGYERDNETSLDFAQARYYSSLQGRFTSADPLLASGRGWQPQSWNRYAYVLNRPLSLVDPTGLEDEETKEHEALDNTEPQKPSKTPTPVGEVGGAGLGPPSTPELPAAVQVNQDKILTGLENSVFTVQLERQQAIELLPTDKEIIYNSAKEGLTFMVKTVLCAVCGFATVGVGSSGPSVSISPDVLTKQPGNALAKAIEKEEAKAKIDKSAQIAIAGARQRAGDGLRRLGFDDKTIKRNMDNAVALGKKRSETSLKDRK